MHALTLLGGKPSQQKCENLVFAPLFRPSPYANFGSKIQVKKILTAESPYPPEIWYISSILQFALFISPEFQEIFPKCQQ